MNMRTQYLAFLLDVLLLRGGLQKYSLRVVNFRNRTYAQSLETGKSFEVDSALYLTEEFYWHLLDSRLLAKTAYYFAATNSFVNKLKQQPPTS